MTGLASLTGEGDGWGLLEGSFLSLEAERVSLEFLRLSFVSFRVLLPAPLDLSPDRDLFLTLSRDEDLLRFLSLDRERCLSLSDLL